MPPKKSSPAPKGAPKSSGKAASPKTAAKPAAVAAKTTPAPAAKNTSPAPKATPTATARVAKSKKTKTGSTRKTRNPLLASGIRRYSRSAMYHRTGAWAKKDWKKVEKKAVTKPAPKTKQFGGGWRVIQKKAPRFYPADDIAVPLHNNRTKHRPTSLRPSITPGTILILLAGRFRGRRVVFLKQLPSGLLLVTGPYKINGVPIKRVNQAYVIATSTKVNVTGLDLAKFDDKYFRRPKAEKKKKTEATLFEPEKKEKVIKPERKEDQKAVDSKLVPEIEKVKYLSVYLTNKFSLQKKQFPHELKF
jgi:large subunit ribosomal protein L6e